ncbi:MAG: response regulator [Eubacterium sp.]|nr:response regulator [Eubacterium sp.]
MNAIAVDDEPLMLYALVKAVKASSDITSVVEFGSCEETLKWVEKNLVDVAFLDIDMRGMGGLALAQKIMELQPDCKIVFCTGYEKYAVTAIKLRVSGYLMKPISAQAVQEEIDYIKGSKAKDRPLTVKCFGNFEVYACGDKLSFKRTKTKELLAFLIDRKGAGVTAKEIRTWLWSENGDEKKYHNYLRQLFLDLRNTLESIGAGDILEQNNYSYSLNVDKIDCDYYTYLKTGLPEFHGEYMTQYSWAEETCGLLWKKNEY